MVKLKETGIDWIGSIPERWDIRKLKYILNNRNESNSEIITDKILTLSVNQGVIPSEEYDGGGNKAKDDISKYKLAYPNDIVMNSMNVLSGSVSLSKYFGCVSPVYYMLYSDCNNIRYYNYLFQTTAFQKSLLGLGNGIMMKESNTGKLNTIRMKIPIDKLKSKLLVFPSVDEQNKIADYLDNRCKEIDKVLNNTKETINYYKALKKSYIIKMVTKGNNSNVKYKKVDNEWIDKIPENWSMVRLDSLFEEIDNRNEDPEEVLLSLYTSIGVRPREELEEKGNKPVTVINYKLVEPGDLVVNKLLAWMGALAYSDYKGATSPDYNVFRKRKNVKIEREYYNSLFRYTCFEGDCFKNGHGIMMMRWRTYPHEFLRIKVPMPPYEEQVEIAKEIKCKCYEIDNLIDKKEQLIEKITEYKDSLIYEYVTGKKEVI